MFVKKKLGLSILLALAMAVALFAFVGCADTNEAVEEEEIPTEMVNVNVSVTGPEGMASMPTTQVELIATATALDTLNATDYPIVTSESSEGPGMVVDSIGDVADTENAKWIYKVNGEIKEEAPSVCIIEEGDTVDWVYENM